MKLKIRAEKQAWQLEHIEDYKNWHDTQIAMAEQGAKARASLYSAKKSKAEQSAVTVQSDQEVKESNHYSLTALQFLDEGTKNEQVLYASLNMPGEDGWDYSAFSNNAWVMSFFADDWIPVAGQIDDIVPIAVGIYAVVQFTIDNQDKIAGNVFIITNGNEASYRSLMSKGSAKNERKINAKVKGAADQKVEELENQLKNAKTNIEREKIKQQLKHWRLKGNQKSEPHGRGSGRH